MSGGGSFNKSKSNNSSSYQDSVWGGQSPYLKDMYKQAGNLFGQTNQGMQGLMPGAVQDMQGIFQGSQPYWQDQMQGGAYKDMGLQNQLMDSLQQSQNNPSAMSEMNAMIMGGEGNNYADAMKDQYVKDANRASDNMMSNLDARAAASGMSGGSRHGMAQGEGMRGINDQLQSQMANTGFNTFDKDLDRKLQIASQADQGTLARQQMMSGMIGQQQQAQQGGLNFGRNMQNMNMGQFSPYNAPWQPMGQYANAIGRPTILGSGQSKGSSSGWGMSGYGGVGPSGGGGG